MRNRNQLRMLRLMSTELTLAGVDIRLRDGCTSKGVEGLYDGEKLKVNTKNKHWFEVYLHEYCHFCQDKLNTKMWKKFQNSKKLKHIGAMEREAELMMFSLNRMFGLGLNEKKLIKRIKDNLDHFGVTLWN